MIRQFGISLATVIGGVTWALMGMWLANYHMQLAIVMVLVLVIAPALLLMLLLGADHPAQPWGSARRRNRKSQ